MINAIRDLSSSSFINQIISNGGHKEVSNINSAYAVVHQRNEHRNRVELCNAVADSAQAGVSLSNKDHEVEDSLLRWRIKHGN